MTEYETRHIAVCVLPKGQEIFSEQATLVSIVDEAGGEYLEVSQSGRTDLGKIAINPEEWPALRSAINQMIEQCRGVA
jgi:hypothetical protein